jgi:hypothetical protein
MTDCQCRWSATKTSTFVVVDDVRSIIIDGGGKLMDQTNSTEDGAFRSRRNEMHISVVDGNSDAIRNTFVGGEIDDDGGSRCVVIMVL